MSNIQNEELKNLIREADNELKTDLDIYTRKLFGIGHNPSTAKAELTKHYLNDLNLWINTYNENKNGKFYHQERTSQIAAKRIWILRKNLHKLDFPDFKLPPIPKIS